jgi:hypothetical protein
MLVWLEALNRHFPVRYAAWLLCAAAALLLGLGWVLGELHGRLGPRRSPCSACTTPPSAAMPCCATTR